MKKFTLALAGLLVLACSVPSFAGSGKLAPGAGAPFPQFDLTTATVVDLAAIAVPAYVKCIWFSQADALPTAGTVDFYDNASAASGTKIFTHTFTAAAFIPFPYCPETNLTNGLYIDFTTTGDVSVIVSHKK